MELRRGCGWGIGKRLEFFCNFIDFLVFFCFIVKYLLVEFFRFILVFIKMFDKMGFDEVG